MAQEYGKGMVPRAVAVVAAQVDPEPRVLTEAEMVDPVLVYWA